jgi:hypothetical protein
VWGWERTPLASNMTIAILAVAVRIAFFLYVTQYNLMGINILEEYTAPVSANEVNLNISHIYLFIYIFFQPLHIH